MKKTLQCIKEIGEKVDLRLVQEFTPEQESFLRAILKQGTLAALDEGLALAAQMIRFSPPGLTRDQLANLIKETVLATKEP
jgi:hypothetical protein